MTDLETRVRDTLADRAGAAGEWRVSGRDLRGAAADRASVRRRRSSAVAAALVVAGVVGIAAWPGGGPRDAAPTEPTPSASESPPPPQPEASWLSVPLTDDMFVRAVAAAGVNTSWSPLVSRRPLGEDDVVVLLSSIPPGTTPPASGFSVVSVTFDSDKPGAAVRSGVLADYSSWADVIAQPARVSGTDWDAVLVVLWPDEPTGPATVSTVTAVTDVPAGPSMAASSSLDDRLGFVPMYRDRPESLTQLVMSAGASVASWPLPPGSPLGAPAAGRASTQWIETSSGEGTPQVVQVRSDGTTACRMTVGSWWDGSPQLPWNAFDSACVTIDGHLQLLIPEDARYSSVAGVVPVGTTYVKLFWRVGKDTATLDVPVTRSGAFIDPSEHRPDQLIRAEAWNRQGQILDVDSP